jgi:hypothetical protein
VPWADRFLLAPLARLALPHLIGRGVPSFAVAASAGIVAIGALAALYFGWPITGLILAIVAMIGLAIGTMTSALRDEAIQLRIQQAIMLAVPALSAVLLGRESAAGWIAAIGAVTAAALVERAGIPRIRRRWWASPPAYPIVMLPFAIFGQPLAALIAAGTYAAMTLGAAIEAFREKP